MLAKDIEGRSGDLGTLEETGRLAFDGLSIQLEQRSGASRIAVGFFPDAADTGWFPDMCEAEGYTSIQVSVQDGVETSARLDAVLAALAESPVFTRGTPVGLCGVGNACALATGFAILVEGSVVLFDPVGKVRQGLAGYVFFDPLRTKPSAPHNGMTWLKCIGAPGGCATAIWRMRLVPSVVPAAMKGELDPTYFYARMRVRKDYRFYRLGVEAALEARGKTDRIPRFRASFQARRHNKTPEGQLARLRTRADQNRPNQHGGWARLRHAAGYGDQPSAGGNVWDLQRDGDRLRYMSDRWRGGTICYVEQDGITLADTPDTALGFFGFGDGLQVERPLARRFPWHVVDAQMNGTTLAKGPVSDASLFSEHSFSGGTVLCTSVALGTAQAGITAAEALPGSTYYKAALAQVKTACDTLKRWDKSLVLDRLRLSLLTGAPDTTETEAAAHYRLVAHSLARDIVDLTGQSTPMAVVVVPQAGGRQDGTSDVALAEARLDFDHPALFVVVPTPAYPFALMPDTQATPSPEAALLMDELCAKAVQARRDGLAWHCPALQSASVTETTILAQFSSMDGLDLADGPHGFHLVGAEKMPEIRHVEIISDTEVKLELDAAPPNGAQLAYAWGHTNTATDRTHSANHGALRDRWHQPSAAVPGQALHRFALPGRVTLLSAEARNAD